MGGARRWFQQRRPARGAAALCAAWLVADAVSAARSRGPAAPDASSLYECRARSTASAAQPTPDTSVALAGVPVAGDDECDGAEGQCAFSALQLRGVRVAAVGEAGEDPVQEDAVAPAPTQAPVNPDIPFAGVRKNGQVALDPDLQAEDEDELGASAGGIWHYALDCSGPCGGEGFCNHFCGPGNACCHAGHQYRPECRAAKWWPVRTFYTCVSTYASEHHQTTTPRPTPRPTPSPSPPPQPAPRYHEVWTHPPTPAPSPPPPPPPPPKKARKPTDDCKDEDKSCAAWAELQQCKKNPAYMKLQCRFSCEICEGEVAVSLGELSSVQQHQSSDDPDECIDKEISCYVWFTHGECKKNPGYMLVHCPKSCGKCKGEQDEKNKEEEVAKQKKQKDAKLKEQQLAHNLADAEKEGDGHTEQGNWFSRIWDSMFGGHSLAEVSAHVDMGVSVEAPTTAKPPSQEEHDDDDDDEDKDDGPCHTAVEGEDCHDAVRWFMSQEFFPHMDEYPSLSVMSSFEAFQAAVHAANSSECPAPCAAKPARCKTAAHGSPCYEAAAWARNDGIYANPTWYPELQAGANSIEEFMAHIHIVDPATCPSAPCLPKYPRYSTPTYRGTFAPMKGIAYGPAPLKVQGGALLDDDFMTDITGQLWADWGRGDLALMKQMGANTLRMYGLDPNETHRTFFDVAFEKGLDVIVGQSDWPFLQAMDRCMLTNWYCYDVVYESYKQNLVHGLTIDGNKTYHPAVKALILLNEPDLKIQPRSQTCRAVASTFDAVLQAEKDVGVTGNPIAITAVWSFAIWDGQDPGLGQMFEFYECLKNTQQQPTAYTPKNDLLRAFRERWVNSFNTANPAFAVKQMLLDKYAAKFWNDEIKIPVFIGEYHSVHVPVRDDVQEMLAATSDKRYPFFMGLNFFEFSVRYDKGGSEEEFGMFAYGSCALSYMNYTGKVYTIWDLKPNRDMKGDVISSALTAAYGGEDLQKMLQAGPCLGAATP